MMRTFLLIFMAQLFLFANAGDCAESSRENESSDNQKNMVTQESLRIRSHAIRMPDGFFVLVRDGDKYGAIRFIESKVNQKSKEGEGGYEAYCQKDGTGDFLKKNAEHVLDTLSQKQPFPIIGRLSVRRGNITILCGSFTIPTTLGNGIGWMYFRDNSLMEPGAGVWMAPTAITNISKVNVFDSRLKWYRHDDSRKDFDLDMATLLNENEKPEQLPNAIDR